MATAKRFFYLDPGLRNDVGHHANYCRSIVGELRTRAIETLVFGHCDLSQSLQSELGAIPHFRVSTYVPYAQWRGWRGWLTDFAIHLTSVLGTFRDHAPGTSRSRGCDVVRSFPPDIDGPLSLSAFIPTPVSAWRSWRGWLTAFAARTRITRDDLFRLPPPESGDVIFMTSARPIQLAALIEWRRALAPARRPTIVVESVRTGLVIRPGKDASQISMPNPQVDPVATLFRQVSHRLPRQEGARFHFITFAPTATDLFKLLLNYPVRTLPLPYNALGPLRNRAGRRPIVVAILGHQRREKGYDQLPAIVEELLRSRSEIRLLIQCVAPEGSPETQQALNEMSARSGRVVLDPTPADRTRWTQLLAASDLVLCPHRPDYYLGFSAVLAEALANGIPAVVPAGSPLETLLRECGGPGAAFDRFEPASIASATGRVLDHFDHFATLAYEAGQRWPETRGAARTIDELMSMVRTSSL